MIFKDFRIYAEFKMHGATCEKCGCDLTEVYGKHSPVYFFCPVCKDIYTVKLSKMPKKQVSDDFLKYCEEQQRKKDIGQ
jgi:uncharacterized Zn finger protein (UPF0148 family)